jgi:hypothetical protein
MTANIPNAFVQTEIEEKDIGKKTIMNTVFCNPDMVRDICNIKNESLDFISNANILRTTQKATIPG